MLFYQADLQYVSKVTMIRSRNKVIKDRCAWRMTVKTLTQVVFFSAELGDFNPDEHKDGYLNGFMFVPNQTREFEQQVAEKHRQHR